MLATDLEIYQDQCEVQNAIAHEYYLDGKADGAFGIKPQNTNPAYLEGWWVSLKEAILALPRDRQGVIQYNEIPQPQSDPTHWLHGITPAQFSYLTPDSEF
jgi:hypothetical protein